MEKENMFIEDFVLPKPLSKEEEVYLLLNRDIKENREKLLMHNLRLVFQRVNKRFSKVNYDKNELISLGIQGLLYAIDHFDLSKSKVFSFYAVTCIDNYILRIYSLSVYKNNFASLDDVIYENDKGRNNILLDYISSDFNVTNHYENKELLSKINLLVNSICNPTRREFVKMYFGFYDKIYTQVEIASIFNVTKQYVSKIIISELKNIKDALVSEEIIEENKNIKL